MYQYNKPLQKQSHTYVYHFQVVFAQQAVSGKNINIIINSSC